MKTPFDRIALHTGALALGCALSETQLAQFETLFVLLEEWNEKLNLTSIDPVDFVALHFLDSLTLYPLISDSKRILDVGTGPGFPGLPLAIALPDATVTVLDSIRKKLEFTRVAAERLGLPLSIRCERAEQAAHAPEMRETFDTVVSRAVADLSLLVHWTLPFLRVGGTAIAMKGKEVQEELEGARADVSALGADIVEVRDVTIPGTSIPRSLVIMRKVSTTPASLPKRGNIKKRR